MKRTKSTKYISTLILILIHTNKHSHTSKALNRIHLIAFLSFSSTEYARRAINLCNCLTLHAISPPRMESANSFLFIIAHCSTCTHTHIHFVWVCWICLHYNTSFMIRMIPYTYLNGILPSEFWFLILNATIWHAIVRDID